MKKPFLAAAVLALVIALPACKQKGFEPALSAHPSGPEPAPHSAKKSPKFATPERIAEIKKSGKTGFWSVPAEFCPGDRVATLTWNVEASGASKVLLYVVSKDGREIPLGRRGPVDERTTGPWLKPGMTFKLRNAQGGTELGSITIPRGKSC